MGRNTKWVDARPDDRVDEVAERALAGWLERMWHYLQRAAEQSDEETENVHRLRVFSRRAGAAITLFEPWLPRRRGRWMQKQVKRIRQAAGAARDCDVLLERWMARGDQLPAERMSLLTDEIRAQRRKAQQPIELVWKKLDKRDFPHKASQLVQRIRGRRAESSEREAFGPMAREALQELVQPYLCAGDAEMDAMALHAFRIQGKQVRYAMEMLAGAFDDEFRQQLYPVVVMLQDKLGIINDHVTAEKCFCQWQADTPECGAREALQSAIDAERRDLDSSRREFLAWWSTDRRAQLRLRFARYVELSEAEPQGMR